ncbi:GIY-YIG nuclease family protein [Myroides sp. JBRI-B21084]|uniref:GIY-YIG nuclease family protein n=1 Tax=Myroides sp. JBRI-B21084 TaxID=3119977 RepID=UPI0026E3FAC4|nr:GIY-YIG nuclease family protein [Paenimyroides cloacae]WKW47510.1 GIY-YIG nuclease family protein [Paenimyroides cloacae]
MSQFYVYIVTNKYRTTFYVGVTNDLNWRSLEHNESRASIFTSKYNLTDLIYYEVYNDINLAISREKQLKSWKKDWKLKLIKDVNPNLETIQLI